MMTAVEILEMALLSTERFSRAAKLSMALAVGIACVYLAHQNRGLHGRSVPSRSISIINRNRSTKKALKCGYNACSQLKKGMINVHLVPHSHDDVGWVKTVQEYFEGTGSSGITGCVRCILDSVIAELIADPKKRFIQVETAFLWRWLSLQNSSRLSAVVSLVDEGRLELVGGGWSMNDEATTHYTGIIDNMAIGFRELKKHFGDCGVPKIGWQIDPFGHSLEQASLFAQMGFDGLFLARIDEDDRLDRKLRGSMEFVWEGNGALGESNSIFTGVFSKHYYPPIGFNYDRRENGFFKSQTLLGKPEEKVHAKIQEFVQFVKDSTRDFKEKNNLMVLMGGDFHFERANENYANLDMLIEHTNALSEETGVRLLYSTPACYLKALNDARMRWPNKTDDFFPYKSDRQTSWTGYFTSRPSFKLHSVESNSLSQSVRQLDALLGSSQQDSLFELVRGVGIAQHHDAITGTAQTHVDKDYHRRLEKGRLTVTRVMAEEIFRRHLHVDLGVDLNDTREFFCPQLNVSECAISEVETRFVVLVYNPLPRSKTFRVRLPFRSTNRVDIFDEDRRPIPIEFVDIPTETRALAGRKGNSDVEAIFKVNNVPPLGYKSVYVEQTVDVEPQIQTVQYRAIPVDSLQEKLPDGLNDVNIKFYVDSRNYAAHRSGAYVFRPSSGTPYGTKVTSATEAKFEDFSELRLNLSIDWAKLSIRLYNSQEAEVLWTVGPIPGKSDMSDVLVTDGTSREAIVTFDSALNNVDEFFTDSNGRQMMKRKKNPRASFKLHNKGQEQVSSNYYPVVAAIYLADNSSDRQMTVIPDRSQGGSSMNSGQLELMVHRRLVHDDGMGVIEPLNELGPDGNGLVARGLHRVFLGDKKSSVRWRRLSMQENYLRPMMLLVPTTLTLGQWAAVDRKRSFSGIVQELPENINIVTLESVGETNQILFRIEHLFEPGEHSELSNEVSVNLVNLFATFEIVAIEEMALGGNIALSEASRLHWDSDWRYGHQEQKHPMEAGRTLDSPVITLRPMEIRTFLLHVQ